MTMLRIFFLPSENEVIHIFQAVNKQIKHLKSLHSRGETSMSHREIRIEYDSS